MPRPNIERKTYSGIITTQDKFAGTTSQSVTTWDQVYREYHGVTTPGFNGIKKKHLPLNSYSLDLRLNIGSRGVYQDYNPNAFGFNYVYTFPSCAMRGGVIPSDWSSSDAMTSARNKAIGRLADKVNALQWNAMQSLAESGQTARLVLTTGRRIAWAALSLKRGDLKNVYVALGISGKPSHREFARISRTPARERVANHWLEYVNGWKPLVREVDTALEALAFRLLDEKNNKIRTKSSATVTRVTNHVNKTWGFNNSTKRVVETTTVKFIAKYRLTSDLRSFAATYGLSNLPALAWELAPSSYIADWFFNISEFLQSLNAFDGFELDEGQEVVFRRITAVCDYNYHFVENGNIEHTSSGDSVHHQVLYTRSAMVGWPTQTLQFRSKFHNETASKIATVLSTLQVLFSPKGAGKGDLLR